MNNIRILDCTLRDGGYINDFKFGNRSIAAILAKLQTAEIDIVECGFLEDGEYDHDQSVFNKISQINSLLPPTRKGKTMFVAMACYGEYDLSQLSRYSGHGVEGIRVTFHYNEVDEALEYCRDIKNLGYKVFVQPVGTTSYSDNQLLELIVKVNELRPYSFYLVDTLGLMVQRDISRFFYLIDHNLNKEIRMGFHSHNNLQLSFSNCQYIASLNTERIISLDASVYGMGRGAGNLNTELIANYLNNFKGSHYRIEPLLEIVDEFISKIKEKYEWGYSVPYYLAAINGCHPNFASYLSSKRTLTIREIATILRSIEPEKRSLFNKDVAEEKYHEHQSIEIDDNESLRIFADKVEGRTIAILGPGPSVISGINHVSETIAKENALVISVGFVPDFCNVDYVFLSNRRRYQTTFNPENKHISLLHTSNIKLPHENKLAFNYSSLIDEDPVISDNSLIMLLNLISRTNPKGIKLAGFDGYIENAQNYYSDRLELPKEIEVNKDINKSMSARLVQIGHIMPIEFITPSLYIE